MVACVAPSLLGMSVFCRPCFASSISRFELLRGIGQQFRNLAKESCSAFLGAGSNFFFHIFAQPRQFFVEPLPNFLKFVHVLPSYRDRALASQTTSPTWVLYERGVRV